MKKTWKKILCSLMLVPCAFFATACGKDDDDDKDVNKTVNLTAAEQQVAYTTFRTLAASALSNDGTKDQSYTLNSSVERIEGINLDNSGLTAENRALVAQNRELSKSIKDTNTIVAGYKSNNTGYIHHTKKEHNWNGAVRQDITNTKHVKYNGQAYQLYEKNNDVKTVGYVNNNYAKTVIPASNNLFCREYDTKEFSDIFDFTQDNVAFDEFKSYLVNWTARSVVGSRAYISLDMDLSDYVSTEYAYSLTDGVYTLSIDLDVDLSSAPIEYYSSSCGTVTGDGKLVVSYDKKSIRKMDFEYLAEESSSLPSKKTFISSYQEFQDSDTVTFTNGKATKMSLDFTTGFDEIFFGQALTGYVGTGANGVVGNISVDAVIYFNNMDFEPITTQFVCNEDLQTSVNNALNQFLVDNDLFVQFSWKKSAEAKDLSLIADTDKVPSTNVEIYIELTEEVREFVSTTVIVRDVEDNRNYTLSLFIDDNLYSEVCAVLGLEENEIEGIYSDAECTQKLATDTKISENMFVYLKMA